MNRKNKIEVFQMNNFKNVDFYQLANIYFEGKVISRNLFLKDSSKKTLGMILIGEYDFNTPSKELIEIDSEKLNLKLKGEDYWKSITEDMKFNVPKNSSFNLEVLELENYTCSYFDN